MVKYFLNFLFVFLMLSSFSFAENSDAKLQEEFGKDLTKAPFFLRFDFNRKFHKDWKETDYRERKVFLIDYKKNLAAQQAQEKADAKAEADLEKQRLLEKKEVELREKNRLKAQEAEEKAEEDAEQGRQKAFNDSVNQQQKVLQDMKQQSVQANN